MSQPTVQHFPRASLMRGWLSVQEENWIHSVPGVYQLVIYVNVPDHWGIVRNINMTYYFRRAWIQVTRFLALHPLV